jgi:hypothetical protein
MMGSARLQPYAFVPSNIKRYIHSLLEDKLLGDVDLPGSNYFGGHMRQSYRTFFQLACGTQNVTGVVLNPYFMWTDQIIIERLVSNATVNTFAKTCYTPSTATSNGQIFDVSNYASASCAGCWATTSGTSYSGHVRPHGIRFRITYTGTELAKGGELVAWHNPQHVGLVNYNEAITAAASCVQPAAEGAFSTTRLDDAVSIHRMGDSFEFVWRPNSLDFKSVHSNFTLEDASVAGMSQANSAVVTEGILGSPDNLYATCDKGYVTGFALAPGTSVTGALAPYYVEIECVYDLSLHYAEGGNGLLANRATDITYSHPVHAAMVQNALAYVHKQRSTHQIPINATSLSLTSVEKTAGAFARKAATGAVEALGEKLMGSMF